MTGRIIIAGGSGFLGRALATDLAGRDNEIVILSRSTESALGPARGVVWDGRTLDGWTTEIDGADTVVNLAGRNINTRFTPTHRREILQSRVDATRVIARAIQQSPRPPRLLIQASAIGYYGGDGDGECDESTPPGDDFLARTCIQWEQALADVPTPFTRRVTLRIGFVLDREQGGLPVLARLGRWFLGGAAGSGRQGMSWIHIADLLGILRWCMNSEDLSGVLNATAPEPVSNAEFMRALRRALGRPWSPPAPSLMVRLGAYLMGTDASLALQGRRCLPRRLLEASYPFHFQTLQAAMRDLLCP